MVTLAPLARLMLRQGFVPAALALPLALGQAQAADLPLRSSLPPVVELPPPPPAPLWSGLHVDLDAGYVRAGPQDLRTVGLSVQEQALIDVGGVGSVPMSNSSFVLRGGLGYDLQLSPGSGFVLGAVADAALTGLDHVSLASFSFGGNDIALRAHQSLDFLGTLRGRLGYAFGPVLVYGTGGLAYGGVAASGYTSLTNASYSGIYDGGRHLGIETGTVYGGGIEWMALPSLASGSLAFKVEYLRYDLGRRSVPIMGLGPVFGSGGLTPVGHTANSSFRTQGQLVTAGVTYRFSGLGE